MNEEQLKILYDSYASKNGFEDFGEFKSLMADESARGVFFEDANSELGFKDINEFNSLLGVGGGSMGKPNIPSASSGGESPSSPSKKIDPSLVAGVQAPEFESETPPQQKQYEKDYFTGDFGYALKSMDAATNLGLGEFIDDMGRAISTGISQGAVTDDALSVMASGREASKEQIEGLIKAKKELESSGPSDEMISFQEEYERGGSDVNSFLKALWKNPDVIPEIMVSSLSAMANPASLSAGGAVTAGAAAGGALVGGVGAGPAALGSIPYAMGAMGGTLETGLTFAELVGDELGDRDWNEDNVRDILNDSEKLNEIRRKAATRGAIIGVVDMLSGKLAGRVGASAMKGGRLSKIGGALASGGIEMAGGAGGEAGARAAIGQEMDAAEIGLEAVGEGPMSVPNVLAQMGVDKAKTPKEVAAQQQHKINGEDLGKKDFVELTKDASGDELSEMNIEIVNDPDLEREISEKIQNARDRNNVLDVLPNLDDNLVDRLVEIDRREAELAENESGLAKLEKSELGKERNEIYEQYRAAQANIDTERKDIESIFTESTEKLSPTIDPILERMDGGEYINDNEIDVALNDVMNEIERIEGSEYSPQAKKETLDLLYDLADQIDDYEFRTTEKTETVTKGRPEQRPRKAIQKPQAEDFFKGTQAILNDEDVVTFDKDGETTVVKFAKDTGKEPIAIETASLEITDREFDDNTGGIKSVELTDMNGNRIKISGEQAMDLSIKDRQSKIGEVPQSVFDAIVEEETRVYEEKYKKTKPIEDAKEQQSGEMREQGEPQQTKGTSDSNLSEVNEAELQDGAKEAVATLKSKPPKQKSVSVESETQGLTPKQQAKQGVTEIVESYKGRIKEIRSTMNERIKQAKQVARDKAKAIRDTQKLLDDFVKETIPQTEKIPRGLARKIANARTDKAVENAMDAIENYLEKSAISKEKNNIRENQKKVAKKLKSTSEYTNKERVVSEFLAGLDLNSISDINTLSEISRVMNDLANKPIANVRESEIKAIKLEPTEKPPKEVKPDDIKAIVDRSFDKERTIQQRAKDINKAVKGVDRLMADGQDVTELESALNDSINSLNEDTKSEITELNKESDSLLKSADLSELSPAQKERVNSLINAGRRKDYRSAKLLNDIAIELSFGYAPIKNIQEYINSEYSRRNADDISSKIDASQSKRKTPIQKKLTEGFFSPIIPNLFKKYGIDNKSLQDVIDDLRLSDWFRWDDYFGLGASKPLYIAVISPLERAVTQHTETFRNTIGSLSKLGRPLKSDAQTKIVMAMVQGYWDNYRSGKDYWGKIIKDPKFKEYHKDRHDFLSKLYDSMPKKNGKIDYDGYLGSLEGIEKKTYDWIVKNNENMKDLQRTANESRGQLFEEIDSRYYIPMRRKKDAPMVSMDGDGYVDNLFKMFSDGVSKLKSDTGINRTDVSIDDLNTNLYKLIQDQVFQTTRDYYVTEAARRSAQTLGKATSATKDLDAKKYLTAMNKALKSRMAEQFGRSKGSGLGVINVVLRAMYQYVLSGFRIPIEAGAETIRGLGATDPKYWEDAARLRASSIENESLRTLLKSTNSPFISQMYFEMIEGGNEFDFNATPTKATYNLLKAYKGLGEFNEKAIASSDAMTFGFTWLPSFLKAFNEKTGKDFDVKGFLNNADKYINDNLSDIKLSASVADNHTQTIKGAKTKMGKREAVKILPFKIKGSSGVRYDMVSSSSSAGRLVTTLQNFAHLENFNIIRNINSAIYQENKTRGAALSEIGSAFISGTFYGLATSLAFTVKQMMLGDDDEKKEAEEEIKRLTSAEGVYDSAISNALFLAGGQYGNISKTAILIAAGLYDSYLKKSLPSSEYKKKSKELSEITRNRYFSEPIKFGGYNSEQKILNALAPFVGRSILVVTKNMAQSGSDAYDFVTGDGDTVKALRMLNSLSVLGLMTMGMSHPFAKEMEYALRDRDKKKKKSTSGSFRILN